MDAGDLGPSDDELASYRPPLPRDDRLWRHPSELDLSAPRFASLARPMGWPVAVISGLIGSVLTFGLVAATGVLADRTSGREVVVRERVGPVSQQGSGAPGQASTEVEDVVRIAEDIRPAIARIEVTQGGRQGSASGVVYRDDGYLLTSAHAVNGASSITVVLDDGDELKADLMGTDDLTDVAVVKVRGEESHEPAALGSAIDLQVGQRTVAIGSPLGLAGGSSVTTGVVSALGRRVTGDGGPPLTDMIQTDAAIAPGSSGGALLDGSGAVIGITTALAVSGLGGEGVGFATPIDIARSAADDIIATGRAEHPWIGVEGRDLVARSSDESDDGSGALVERVVPDSPAADAGVKAEDVIVAVSDRQVRSMSNLAIALQEARPGEKVGLTVSRDGRRSSLPVTLAERPSE